MIRISKSENMWTPSSGSSKACGSWFWIGLHQLSLAWYNSTLASWQLDNAGKNSMLAVCVMLLCCDEDGFAVDVKINGAVGVLVVGVRYAPNSDLFFFSFLPSVLFLSSIFFFWDWEVLVVGSERKKGSDGIGVCKDGVSGVSAVGI